MAQTLLSDLWVPDIWVRGVDEAMATLPGLMNSGIAVRSAQMDALASGPAQTVNVPFFLDITDQNDAPQVEDTAPTKQNTPTGSQTAIILNRETSNGATALSAAVSGEDPVGYVTSKLAARRLKQRQKTLLELLRGVLLSANFSANVESNISESVAGQTADHLIDADMFLDGANRLGELVDGLNGGAVAMHTDVRTALRKQDEIAFEKVSTQGGLTIETYKGIPVYVSDLLSRAGTTDGTVYQTFLIARGAVAWGEKPQVGDQIDVASLQYDMDRQKNNETIIDRTRFMMHLAGAKWAGTVAGQSATNAEISGTDAWTLAYQTANRIPAVLIQSNG